MNDPKQSGVFVMNFNFPHGIGSVCRFPCSQCGETEEMGGLIAFEDGFNPVPTSNETPALLVLRDAKYEEWLAQVLASGGNGRIIPRREGFNYWVTTD